METEEILVNCDCCKKQIPKYANRKYCTNCSNYLLELRRKTSSYKNQLKKLKIKFYGTDNLNWLSKNKKSQNKVE